TNAVGATRGRGVGRRRGAGRSPVVVAHGGGSGVDQRTRRDAREPSRGGGLRPARGRHGRGRHSGAGRGRRHRPVGSARGPTGLRRRARAVAAGSLSRRSTRTGGAAACGGAILAPTPGGSVAGAVGQLGAWEG